MAPSRWSRARHNISEIFEPREQGLQTVALNQAGARGSNRREYVGKTKTFPVFNEKKRCVNLISHRDCHAQTQIHSICDWRCFRYFSATMVLPVKRWFAIAFLVSSIAITQTTALAADDWQIIKVSGQDYLSVD